MKNLYFFATWKKKLMANFFSVQGSHNIIKQVEQIKVIQK